MICGYRDAARFALSDQTCTALQLVNFWQDVRRDLLDRDRVYIPRDVAAAHRLDLDALRAGVLAGDVCDDDDVGAAYRATVRDLVARTRLGFERGRALLPLVRDDVRPAIRLFTLGGEAVLRKIVRAGYATHRRRPRVGRLGKAALLARAWLSSLTTGKEQP
jgi:phytoene/squalene synthetase